MDIELDVHGTPAVSQEGAECLLKDKIVAVNSLTGLEWCKKRRCNRMCNSMESRTILRASPNSAVNKLSLISVSIVKHMQQMKSCLLESARRASHNRQVSGRSNSRAKSVVIHRTE